MPEAGRHEFERAVAAFPLVELPLEGAPLEIGRESLERTGLFVLGESHGIAETANAVLALVRRLGVRAVAFEWSYDEVEDVVQAVFATGRIDLDALWRTPVGGDLFAGDGRFTAGHVRLVEDLVATGELEQVILVDRLGSEGAEREAEMAARLLDALRRDLGVIAVVGHVHALRRATDGVEPMFAHLARVLPRAANGSLSFSSGTCHHRGDRGVWPIRDETDARFELGVATAAVVPAK